MTSVRCPSCGAGCPETADWCSMCYHRFRPVEPVPAATVAPPPQETVAGSGATSAPARVAVVDPLTAPLPLVSPPGPGPVAPVTAAERPAESSATTWPCPTCGASVPLAQDGCEACGAGFLAPAKSRLSLRLPVVGDVVALTQAQRLVVAMVVGCGLVVVFVLLAAIGGSLF